MNRTRRSLVVALLVGLVGVASIASAQDVLIIQNNTP